MRACCPYLQGISSLRKGLRSCLDKIRVCKDFRHSSDLTRCRPYDKDMQKRFLAEVRNLPVLYFVQTISGVQSTSYSTGTVGSFADDKVKEVSGKSDRSPSSGAELILRFPVELHGAFPKHRSNFTLWYDFSKYAFDGGYWACEPQPGPRQ